jgi:hypothetical protein
MSHRVEIDRTYGPEALAVVGVAFDRVWQAALKRMKSMNGNDDAKRALALTVLRLFDQGERDPERLAEIALREWSAPTVRQSETVGRQGDRPLGSSRSRMECQS